MLFEIFILLLAFQFKYFIINHNIQTRKLKGSEVILTPLERALHNAIATFLISALFIDSFRNVSNEINFLIIIGISLGNLILHFIIDVIKTSPQLLGRYNIDENGFWIALGTNQILHHLTHYLLIFILISYTI